MCCSLHNFTRPRGLTVTLAAKWLLDSLNVVALPKLSVPCRLKAMVLSFAFSVVSFEFHLAGSSQYAASFCAQSWCVEQVQFSSSLIITQFAFSNFVIR